MDSLSQLACPLFASGHSAPRKQEHRAWALSRKEQQRVQRAHDSTGESEVVSRSRPGGFMKIPLPSPPPPAPGFSSVYDMFHFTWHADKNKAFLQITFFPVDYFCSKSSCYINPSCSLKRSHIFPKIAFLF